MVGTSRRADAGAMTNDDTTPRPPEGEQPGPSGDPAASSHSPSDPAANHDSPTDPTPPPYPYGPRLPLRRSRTDRKIAGVAGGLGRHFDVDPLIIRVVLVVLAIFGGSGLLLYGLGWLLIPDEGTDRSEADRLLHSRGGGSAVPPIVLAVIGAIAVVGLLTYSPGRAALAVIVVAAVVMALSTRSRRENPGAWSSPPPAGGWQQPYASTRPTEPVGGPAPVQPGWSTWGPAGGTATIAPPYTPPYTPPYAPPAAPSWPAEPPAPRPPSSPLGRITMSAALLVAGLVIAGQVIADGRVHAVPVLASALAVLAAGLVVGTFWGRARWLVLPASLVAVALVVAANVPHLPSGGIGQRTYDPRSVAEVDSPYQLGIGDLQLDLSDVHPAPGQVVDVTAEVGIGQVKVFVDPADNLELTARAGNGAIDVDGVRQQGHDLRVTRSQAGVPAIGSTPAPTGPATGSTTGSTAAPAAGTIVLHLKAGIGQLEVFHATA